MTSTERKLSGFVTLATEDGDLGVFTTTNAAKRARAQANRTGKQVFARDPVTDKVLWTAEPSMIAMYAQHQEHNMRTKKTRTVAADVISTGEVVQSPVTEPKKPATKKPRKPAAKKPAKAKSVKSTSAKKAKKANGKAPAKTARKGKAGPSGMVVEILKLSSRKDGVTPAELNALTSWKGAPWKWLFSNPKKTGYADRWGYSFAAVKDDHGAVHYKTAKLS